MEAQNLNSPIFLKADELRGELPFGSEAAPKWLSVVGIGEDGLAGLSPIGRSLLSQATVIVGGERHLAMLPASDRREKLAWSSPLQASLQQIAQRRGQAVCVLASGDPLCYGIGSSLIRQIPIAEMSIVPAPSAFSLACARLGWAMVEVEMLSLCGRDPSLLNAVLYPQAKVLVLSADRSTPAIVAQRLIQAGYGNSQITVLERMGGIHERITSKTASEWLSSSPDNDLSDLNTIAIDVLEAEPIDSAKRHLACHLAGLPDVAYDHDGQLTKREIRAVTLAALSPLPGELLWDVGAGCGSIAIEWLRSDRRCRAIAIEQHPTRLQYIAHNAATLGVPQLQVVAGTAPIALAGLPHPHAIFIGGGVTAPELLETCWRSLPVGGRLVSNAVTVESEQLLFQWQKRVGGTLSRIAIQRAEPIGRFLGWKAMAPVTQWAVVKATSGS